MEDLSHVGLIEWFVGIIIVAGGAMLGIVAKMVKGKQTRVECTLLHKTLTESLLDIKQRLERGDSKMDGMNTTLVKISTILELRSQDETDRYDRHSKKWKDE